jgi:hypothetical protein
VVIQKYIPTILPYYRTVVEIPPPTVVVVATYHGMTDRVIVVAVEEDVVHRSILPKVVDIIIIDHEDHYRRYMQVDKVLEMDWVVP